MWQRLFNSRSGSRYGAARTASVASRAASSPSSAPSTSSPIHVAKQLYEEVWSHGSVDLLNTIMAEDHVQNDACWNAVSGLVVGRDKISRGIRGFRVGYPDLSFRVLSAVQLPANADDVLSPSGVRVMVEWKGTGTNQRPVLGNKATHKAMEIRGVAILSMEQRQQGDGQGTWVIVRSDVFRQATPEEMAPFRPIQEEMHRKMRSASGGVTVGASGEVPEQVTASPRVAP